MVPTFHCVPKQLHNWLTLDQNKSGCPGSTTGYFAASYVFLFLFFFLGGGRVEVGKGVWSCLCLRFEPLEVFLIKKSPNT